MGKLISQMMVSLDGYMEGADGELDWHHVDEKYHEYAEGLLHAADAIVFGRRTYEHMEAFWPTAVAAERFPGVAARMNEKRKIVISNTLEQAQWANATVIPGRGEEAVMKLKQDMEGDLVILASSDLAASLSDAGLIDEYHIIVNPVVLGRGKKVFHGVQRRVMLKPMHTQSFPSGSMLMWYQSVNGIQGDTADAIT